MAQSSLAGSTARKVSARIVDHFASLTDPRRRKVTYPLINVVTIAVCAVICGADDFVAIADYGRKKRKCLSQFLDLTNGIPSHDRFNAILGAIKPAEFEACLLSWITDLHEITAGQVVAIDGKTLRRLLQQVFVCSVLTTSCGGASVAWHYAPVGSGL